MLHVVNCCTQGAMAEKRLLLWHYLSQNPNRRAR